MGCLLKTFACATVAAVVAFVALPLAGWSADTSEAVVEATLTAGPGVVGYLDQLSGVMDWVVKNQTLVVGFVAALIGIYGGIQQVNRRRNRDAMDAVAEQVPADTLNYVAESLTPSVRDKLVRSIARTKAVK